MRRGVALVTVLWLIAVLTVMMYAALFVARSEYTLASTYSEEQKVRQIALSGIEYAVAQLMADSTRHDTLMETWFDSEATFKDIAVGEGTFSIIRPDLWDDSGTLKYGIQDEAGKASLNTTPPPFMKNWPGLNESIAAAIADWRDEDSNPSPGGCEDEYYGTLSPAYRAKNAPFETIEELLYVRDITPSVLWGRDTNMDGILSPGEQVGTKASDFGLYHLVTCWSWDANNTNDGKKRVNLNKASREELQQAIGDVYAPQEINMIVNFRNAAPFGSIGNLLDVPGIEQSRRKLQRVADRVTTVDDEKIPGLLNINTAPKSLLKAYGVLSDELIEKILGYRKRTDADLSSVGWLLDVFEDKDLNTFKMIVGSLTVRSRHYRIDVVARLTDRPLYKRYMAVVEIDDENKKARIVYFKDISHLVVKAW